MIIQCKRCGDEFSRPQSQAARAKFCSVECHNAAQTTAERREIKCAQCQQVFTSKKDHGVWRKFCSRTCFLAGCTPRPKEPVPCKSCGSLFLPDKHSRKFCSPKCRSAGLERKAEPRVCENCQQSFVATEGRVANYPVRFCCKACASEFLRQDRGVNWKGGSYLASSGHVMVYVGNSDGVARYQAEHRLVAGRAIGRPLTRSENVIHLNGQGADNRPENLFICASASEMQKRVQGRLPWPKESNLNSYECMNQPEVFE